MNFPYYTNFVYNVETSEMSESLSVPPSRITTWQTGEILFSFLLLCGIFPGFLSENIFQKYDSSIYNNGM